MTVLTVDESTELRPLQLESAAELFALVESSRESLRKWLTWVDGTRSPADVEAYITGVLQRASEGRECQFGIWREGRLVGAIGYCLEERRAEIGYWLDEGSRGQGVMTRACKVLVDHLFKEEGVEAIEIRCAVGNLKSRSIPERLGFRQGRTIPEAVTFPDRALDLLVYVMSEAE